MDELNPHLRTGHATIDDQHCEFIRQLKDLKTALDAGAGRERIAGMITLLQQYALIHFSDEEAYMAKVGCPALDENRAAHREFSRRLEGWTMLLSTGGSSVSLLSDIQRESTIWMMGHIAKVDCKLKGCRVLS